MLHHYLLEIPVPHNVPSHCTASDQPWRPWNAATFWDGWVWCHFGWPYDRGVCCWGWKRCPPGQEVGNCRASSFIVWTWDRVTPKWMRLGFLRSGTQDMLDSCLDSGWMSTTLFPSNAPSLPPWNSIHTLYQDQTKERVNFYNNRNGNMHLSSSHKREGERERESTCVWLPNLCTFFFSNTRSKLFISKHPNSMEES